MGYSGNYTRKRRNYRRGRTTKKYVKRAPGQSDVGAAMQTAGAAYRLAKSLAGIINSELKHYDESNNNTPDSSTGSIFSLVRGMAQGDTNNTIEGNSILLKKINLRGTVTINASASTSRVRMLVLRDTRPISAVPAITDILSSSNVTSFMNIDDQLNRFVVLAQKTFAIDIQQLREVPFSFNFNLNHHIKFNDAQTPVLNDIVVALLSDEATNTPTVNMQSRLRYYDN